MRVPLDWLEEFVALPPPDALAERLNLGGFEDAFVEQTGPDLSALRVGQVLECRRHPNADRLSLCRVDAGDGEPLEVVCGAPNVAEGQKIAFAASGCVLPDGTKLKRSKIRGVVSNGMICSARELGLGEDHEGILVLDPDAPLGAPLAEVLKAGEQVLEVGITPNRGDTASLLGLAREVRALFGGEIRLPETEPAETGAPAAEAVRVAIDAPEDCHHYVARVVRGVRVAASPEWVQQRLEASGIRSINNVVDATNLALLELGQPLHAFDLARLRDRRIRVRRAASGEKLVALDGQTLALDAEDLVIADAERPVALAGVMGGADTEVTQSTSEVLIESAHFHPTRVRLGARRHGLRTEASYRFERGVDRGGVARAADRAARLLSELAGGEVAPGRVEERGSGAEEIREIELEVARSNRLLGTALEPAAAASLLERVGVRCAEKSPGVLRCDVPSHRNDLRAREDLTEEIARIYGYERIPITLPMAPLQPVERPLEWRLAERARDALAGAGLAECVSMPFCGEGDLRALGLAADDERSRALRLQNPIREEEPLLRTTLAASLLRVAQHNRSRQVERVRVFELCRVFLPRGGSEAPLEPLWVAAVLTESADRELWGSPEPAPLFFEARGVAERLVDQLGYVASLQGGRAQPYLHPGAAAGIAVRGRSVGALGEIHPDVAAKFEIDVPCALVELDLSALGELAPEPRRYREVSRHPSVRRDLAVLVDRGQAAGELLAAIRSSAGADLVSLELFDRYEGRGVPDGRVSLGFRLVFQKPDRTLTDAEVAKASDRVVRMLSHRFGAELR